MNQLRNFWNVSNQRFKMMIKLRAALHITYDFLIWLIHLRLIGMKHSQWPQVLPCWSLHSQPQLFAPSLQTARPSSSWPMLPLQSPMIPATPLSCRNRPSVSQHQDVTTGGHSSSCLHAFARTQNADVGQPESHTNTVNNHVYGERNRSRGNIGDTIRKWCGWSPQCHAAEKLQLAVSSRPLWPTAVLLC